MLTMMMCPNCRHQFPVSGCCGFGSQHENVGIHFPENFNNTNGCIINAPTIINSPTIIQSNDQNGFNRIHAWKEEEDNVIRLSSLHSSPGYQLNTTCDLTGGTVTITTPRMQSGGCLIQSTDSTFFPYSPRIEIRPKLSGGSYSITKNLPFNFSSNDTIFSDIYSEDFTTNVQYFEEKLSSNEETEEMELITPPNGCQELPGIRRNSTVKIPENQSLSSSKVFNNIQQTSCNLNKTLNNNEKKSCECACKCKSSSKCCHGHLTSTSSCSNLNSDDATQIKVNATVQIPANFGQCTVNITATTNSRLDAGGTSMTIKKNLNNFNGGGLVKIGTNPPAVISENVPTSPVTWFLSEPCKFDNIQDEHARLVEVKRVLRNTGWYYEDLNWQQSKDLLNHAPIGKWLLRNSSDSRYAFAVSVQTNKGPTSIRVVYSGGIFRLDSDPRVLCYRSFHCPIQMLTYYSTSLTNKNDEIWVDNNGQFVSRIILNEPLVKGTRLLSHLSRLVINKYKLNTKQLPPLLKMYLAEYPYTF